MAVAYNLNLILADKTGKAVLFETFDGTKAWKQINATTKEQYLHSTNHAHLPEIKPLSPMAMEHSACRYHFISSYMAKTDKLTSEDLKALLLAEYPNGLCCHWYEEFFGTVRSMVFDVTAETVEICWGCLSENGWNVYSLKEDLTTQVPSIRINVEHPTFDFCKLV